MDYALARHNMVESQVRPNLVTDPLLIAAMEELPREAFLPDGQKAVAYVDEDIPLGHGRYLMEPMVLARLLQTAEVSADDVALVIGCGAGYETAVLARLASTVVALESNPALVAQATKTFAELGIDTVAVVQGPLEKGYPGQAPYDVIFLNGAVADVPAEILGQLAEGGRLVTVLRKSCVGKGVLFARYDGVISRRDVFDAATPLLPEFAAKPGFTF